MMRDVEGIIEQPAAQRVLWPYALAVVVTAAVPFALVPKLWRNADSADFLPHRFCYLNTAGLVWTNVAADAVIGLSYVAISATLAYLVHRARKDIPFSWMFLAFGLFIVACGGTHFMEVLTVWKPFYWLAADVKIVTAVASLVTAVLLPTLVPKIFGLLSATQVAAERKQQLEAANARLTELEQMSVQITGEAATGLAFWEWQVREGAMKWWGDLGQVLGVANPAQVDSAREFLGMVLLEDRGKVEGISRLTLENPQCDTEFRVSGRDGGVRWLIGKARMMQDGATAMGVFLDVTARKQAETALQRSEKLAVTGRLAASVAHEINNPLQAVGNALYVVGHDESLSPPSREALWMADAEVKRIATIVRNLLGFHRDASSAQASDVGEVLESALSLYEPEIRKRELRVERDYAPVSAVMKRSEMRQVFANLISNALEALQRGGRLRIKIRADGNRVKVTLTDNGTGIPREARARLFEPFFTTKGEKGTGLGLWVSCGIVEREGGEIRFRSMKGELVRGTSFVVILPLSGV